MGLRPSLAALLERYVGRPEVTMSRHGDATELRISKPEAVSVKVDLPDSVLEWWVSVVDSSTGDELALDWCEHPDAEEMETEIARLLDAVVDVPVRVIPQQKPSWLPWRKPKTVYVLQSRVGTDWKQVIPFWTG